MASLADRLPQRSAVLDVFTEDAADDSSITHNIQKPVRVCIPQIDFAIAVVQDVDLHLPGPHEKTYLVQCGK